MNQIAEHWIVPAIESPNETFDCAICLQSIEKGTGVHTCKCDPNKHAFHNDCLCHWLSTGNTNCPVCQKLVGIRQGLQPKGTMSFQSIPRSLPGYTCQTIGIFYDIPDGNQDERHDHPGNPFYGTSRWAYLPANDQGIETFRLLKKAFDNKLIFRVGTSLTTGENNVVCWGTIHHKTQFTGTWGYPDVDYFDRVKEECKLHGVF